MDLNGIDLNLLVAFNALMNERNVTRAGASIYRSQPAMSAALSRLRTLLKDELFIRGPDGLQPTPKALDLAEPIALALGEIQRALEFTQEFDPSSSSATFTLGLPEHPTYFLLPHLLSTLREQVPDIKLRIRGFTPRDDAINLLDAGTVDIVIGVPPTFITGRILSRPLFEERFVCILRKDHPAAQMPLTLETFIGLHHILVSPEGDHVGLVDIALEKLGHKRTLGLTLPHMYAAPLLVAKSDMVATMMEGVVAASGYADKLAILPLPVELTAIPFVMLWHRRNEAHPAQRWLRDLIVRVVATKLKDDFI